MTSYALSKNNLILAQSNTSLAKELWTPSNISTVAWYDASDTSTISTGMSGLSAWNDKSGNNNHISQLSANYQPETGTRTINSLNTINFNASSFIFTNTGMPDGNVTMFAVFSTDGISSTMVVGNLGPVTFRTRQYLTTTSIDYGNNPLTYSPALSTSTVYMIGSRVTDLGTSSVQGYRINGGAETTGGTSRGIANSTISIGAYPSIPPQSLFDGIVGEVIIINSLLSDSDRQKVEGYLAWKWGLVGSLPVNHTYKLTPPRIGE